MYLILWRTICAERSLKRIYIDSEFSEFDQETKEQTAVAESGEMKREEEKDCVTRRIKISGIYFVVFEKKPARYARSDAITSGNASACGEVWRQSKPNLRDTARRDID